MTEEKLIELQRECKYRNLGIKPSLPQRTVNGILFFDGTYIPAVKNLFTKSGKLKPYAMARRQHNVSLRNKYKQTKPVPMKEKVMQEKPPLPKPFKKEISAWTPPQLPKQEKKWERPKAVYTNISSPYGLATEMLNDQMKTG